MFSSKYLSVMNAAFWIRSIASLVTSIGVPKGKVTSTITPSPSMGGKKLNFSHPPPIRPIFRSKIKTKIDIVKNGFLIDLSNRGLYLFLIKFFRLFSILD